MGRTLHYHFKPLNGIFSKKELEKLNNVGQVYRDKCQWTCENISINPYGFYPNWRQFNAAKNKMETGWETVTKRYKELKEQELHHNEIAKQLVKEGIALFHRENPQYGFSGFTKVGGNELNALQVIMALCAASRVVKNCSITVKDEGEFLKCPIVIENDKAMPDDEDISSQISYLLSKALFDEAYKRHKEEFIKKAEILYSFINPPHGVWISSKPDKPISIYCRPINPKDFENYPEYNAAQIMAGFEGEYFGLSQKDPEAASYRMIAMFQKLLPKDCELKVAPKIPTI